MFQKRIVLVFAGAMRFVVLKAFYERNFYCGESCYKGFA